MGFWTRFCISGNYLLIFPVCLLVYNLSLYLYKFKGTGPG